MGVYSLMAEPPNESGTAIRLEMAVLQPAGRDSLTPEDIQVAGQVDAEVKQSAKRGAWMAYQGLQKRGAISPKSEIARSGIAFDFVGDASNSINGPSAGLCFLVRMAQALLEESLQHQGRPVPPHEFAATGIFSSLTDNRVRRVEAITAKIDAALKVLPAGGIVFYPAEDGPPDPTLSLRAKYTRIELVGVDTPEEVLAFLLKHYEISAGTSERPKSRRPNRRWPNAMLGAGLAVMLVILGGLWWAPGQSPEESNSAVSPETVNPGPSKPAAPPSLRARAALFYEGPKDSPPLPLSEGTTLSQGDGFKLEVETDQDCYLYVLGMDSADQIAWLFPPERYLQPLPRGRRWIPDSQWFELDAVSGEEMVLVLATATPSEHLEERQLQIEASKRLSAAERQALKAEIMSYVERRQAEGDILERLTFQHR